MVYKLKKCKKGLKKCKKVFFKDNSIYKYLNTYKWLLEYLLVLTGFVPRRTLIV
jgi:hypothetical protein